MAGGSSGVHQKTLVWECSGWGPSKTLPLSCLKFPKSKIRWVCSDQSYKLAEPKGSNGG